MDNQEIIKNTLKFGDYALFYCEQENKMQYLLARSELDKQLYIAESLKSEKNKSLGQYHMQEQMIFQIYPKLSFQAQKNYRKWQHQQNNKQFLDKQDEKNTETIQQSLLLKHIQTEKQNNEQQIKSHQGQTVKYGDIILLFHPLSQTFVQISTKSVARQSENSGQFLLYLSHQINADVYFQLIPHQSQTNRALQSNVEIDDQFILQSHKMKTFLEFQNLIQIEQLLKVVNSKNLDYNENYLSHPLIIQNQYNINYYKASHKKYLANNKQDKIDVNPISVMILDQKQSNNQLKYGQYVRIRIDLTSKKKKQDQIVLSDNLQDQKNNSHDGYFTCSMNSIGLYPQILVQINGNSNKLIQEQFNSIFQIVPDLDSQFGKDVVLNVASSQGQQVGFVNLKLRHLVSGKFLTVSKKNRLVLHEQTWEKNVNLPNNFLQNTLGISQIIQSTKIPLALQIYKDWMSQKQNMDVIFESNEANQLGKNDQNKTNQNKQFQQRKTITESLISDKKIDSQSFMFVQKIQNSSIAEATFELDQQFNIGLVENFSMICVNQAEELTYQEKLTQKFRQFDDIQDFDYNESLYLLLPALEGTKKKNKSKLSQIENTLLTNLENNISQWKKRKDQIGHFKEQNRTFMPTFVNLNPFQSQYFEIIAKDQGNNNPLQSPVQSSQFGSEFKFEEINQNLIFCFNNIIPFLYPLIELAKNPVHLVIVKLPLHLIENKQVQQGLENQIKDAFYKSQNLLQISQQSLVGTIQWIMNEDQLSFSGQKTEKLNMIRELGLIDLVIKILYELYIQGLLYSNNIINSHREQLLQSQTKSNSISSVDMEVDNLIDAISYFLQIVTQDSYENSLFVVQWYYLFKEILCEGQELKQCLRLDSLIVQLFKLTDINITFQHEVGSLAQVAQYQNYNRHAYSLLIAFCLHSSFRSKESLDELINIILIEQRQTIFGQIYDEDRQNCSNGAHVVSCIQLMSHLCKQNPSMVIKHVEKILTFEQCNKIAMDRKNTAIIRSTFLALLQNCWLSYDLLQLLDINLPVRVRFRQKIAQERFVEIFFKSTDRNGVGSSREYYQWFSNRKINEQLLKIHDRYLTQIWECQKQYINDFWNLNKSIYNIPSAENQYLKENLKMFLTMFNKGVFLKLINQNKYFYIEINAIFKKFLHGCVRSIRDVKHKQFVDANPQTNEISQHAHLQLKKVGWFIPLLEILLNLEKMSQSIQVDVFIQQDGNGKFFDEFQMLNSIKVKNYHQLLNKLRQVKSQSHHFIHKYNQGQINEQFKQTFENSQMASETEIHQFIIDLTDGLKEEAGKFIKRFYGPDKNFIADLTELMKISQENLYNHILEIIWTSFQGSSIFLETINDLQVIDVNEQLFLIGQNQQQNIDDQGSVQGSIYTEFVSIFWSIHLELTLLNGKTKNSDGAISGKQLDTFENISKKIQSYETINTALGNILLIFYPTYSAKSDFQLFQELNEVEVQEKRNNLYVPASQNNKNKKWTGDFMEDNEEHKPLKPYENSRLNEIELAGNNQGNLYKTPQEQEQISSLPNQDDSFIWNINPQLSVNVISIQQRQRMLRILGFNQLMEKLIQNLLSETNGGVTRDIVKQTDPQKIKLSELTKSILEKILMFLLYFELNNFENQKQVLENSNFLSLIRAESRTLQKLAFRVLAEALRDNTEILFSINQSNQIINQILKRLEAQLQDKNYESCIYCLQLLRFILKAQNLEVAQNSLLTVLLIKNMKINFTQIFHQIMKQCCDIKVQDHYEKNNCINVPMVICLAIELVNFLPNLSIKSSSIIEEFIKSLIPIQLIQELIEQLDQWYPLKLQILILFDRIYIKNLQSLQIDEKKEIQSLILECVVTQLNAAFTQNEIVKTNYFLGVNFKNQIVSNNFQIRSYFSNQDLLYNVEYNKSAHYYIILGVVQIIKNYILLEFPNLNISHNRSERIKNEIDKNEELIEMADVILMDLNSTKNLIKKMQKLNINDQENIEFPQNNIQFIKNKQKKHSKSKAMLQKFMTIGPDDVNLDSFDQILFNENENDEQEFIRQIIYECDNLLDDDLAKQALQLTEMSAKDQIIYRKWESIIDANQLKLIEEKQIKMEEQSGIQKMIVTLVDIQQKDNSLFKTFVQALIGILQNQNNSSTHKKRSISILKYLSNFKNYNKEIQIQNDLVQLGYTQFLCNKIISEETNQAKSEYILALVEFLQDSSRKIQESLYQFMIRDSKNLFLNSLKSFIDQSFNEIRLQTGFGSEFIDDEVFFDVSSNKLDKKQILKEFFNEKVKCSQLALEILRLSCENHYSDMQNFLRVGSEEGKSINMIKFIAELFEKYIWIMNDQTKDLGEKILEFLIESVQGPCIGNQQELCRHTHILESLENANSILQLQNSKLIMKDLQFSSLRYKIALLQLSMVEGCKDNEGLKKIASIFNPQFLLKRLEIVHTSFPKTDLKKIDVNFSINEVKSLINDYLDSNTIHNTKKRNLKSRMIAYNDCLYQAGQKLESQVQPMQNKLQNGQQGIKNKKVFQTIKLKTQATLQIDIYTDQMIQQCLPQIIKECFLIFILLKKMKREVPQIKQFINFSGNDQQQAQKYFQKNTASIELINMHGDLEIVHFPKTSYMKHLSYESKEKFLEQVNRESIHDKINGLMDEFDIFFTEMEYFKKLNQIGIRYNNMIFYMLRLTSLLFLITVNLWLLFDNRLYLGIQDMINNQNDVLNALKIALIGNYCIILIVWCVFRLKLEYLKIFSQINTRVQLEFQQGNKLSKIMKIRNVILKWIILIQVIFMQSYTFYFFGLFTLSFLGYFISPIFYGIALFDFIDHNIVLSNVTKSLTRNFSQLLMTLFLGVLVIHVYSDIMYYVLYFREEITNINNIPDCINAFQCFVFVLHQGIRAGGGIGDYLQEFDNTDEQSVGSQVWIDNNYDFYKMRVNYDLTFFFIIQVLWLNIIQGLVIDAFAELRDEKNIKDFDRQNNCFICNISRSTFEKEGLSFDNHVKRQHYIWSYVAYLTYLKIKPVQDYTGIETYVSTKVKNGDISWIPIDRAVKLAKQKDYE